MCQRERGEWTLYRCLLTASLHHRITPIGSVLNSECLILSLWTRCPLLCSNPFNILMPMLGWDCCVERTKSSSSSSFISLNIPKLNKVTPLFIIIIIGLVTIRGRRRWGGGGVGWQTRF